MDISKDKSFLFETEDLKNVDTSIRFFGSKV